LEWVNNRLTRVLLRHGFAPRAYALLETTGRRSGLARQTPVGNGLMGDVFWLVAAHGDQADYVRNLRANRRVRVKVAGVWHSGTATVLDGDDVRARWRAHPYSWDAAIGRMIATTPVTVRIDLDRATSADGDQPASGDEVGQ
jgi:deazaflavin-dependent oxidoreductase (nitroreductase family)